MSAAQVLISIGDTTSNWPMRIWGGALRLSEGQARFGRGEDQLRYGGDFGQDMPIPSQEGGNIHGGVCLTVGFVAASLALVPALAGKACRVVGQGMQKRSLHGPHR
jgi:hypothetical protein